jgi:hypothetical protein
MKTYCFELDSDTGAYFVRVYARNWKSAIETVCEWQKCPKRAIIAKWIYRDKTELTFE